MSKRVKAEAARPLEAEAHITQSQFHYFGGLGKWTRPLDGKRYKGAVVVYNLTQLAISPLMF